jgi:hypothetical protein
MGLVLKNQHYQPDMISADISVSGVCTCLAVACKPAVNRGTGLRHRRWLAAAAHSTMHEMQQGYRENRLAEPPTHTDTQRMGRTAVAGVWVQCIHIDMRTMLATNKNSPPADIKAALEGRSPGQSRPNPPTQPHTHQIDVLFRGTTLTGCKHTPRTTPARSIALGTLQTSIHSFMHA